MKRFTETGKWADPWFRKLDPMAKLLWWWVCDNCDNAGVIDIDIELAAFQIGYAIPIDTLSVFGDRITKLEGGKYFIPKFIGFQYGELSSECKAHNPVFASLEKHGLKGYQKGIHRDQEKDKDKDKVKDTEKAKPTRPTLDEVKECCKKNELPESDAVWFWNKCEANGWTNGGKPIKSWSHTIASWKAAGYLPSQKNGAGMPAAPKPEKNLDVWHIGDGKYNLTYGPKREHFPNDSSFSTHLSTWENWRANRLRQKEAK